MKPWKKLLIYFVSITSTLLISFIIVVACGGEIDPYDYYTSFFHANTQGKKDYGAFYFTDYQFTYDNVEPTSEATVNSVDWASYLGTAVKAPDVEKVMYGLDSAGNKKVALSLDQNLPLADSLTGNSFLAALKQPGHDAALQYYKFALEVEPLSNKTYDRWKPVQTDTANLSIVVQKALTAANLANDDFIKLRYYYQAQRLLHFGKNYEQARKIYDQHIAKSPSKSHVKGWALSCKAGEDRWLGDTTKAAYQFSKVFANYPERRLQAYRNYHYINAPFGDVLKLATNTEEKANLYAIRGFSNADIETDALGEAYANAPASPLVGVLLVREINKLEQYYLTPALANNTGEAYSNQPVHITANQPVTAVISKWPLVMGVIIFFVGGAVIVWAAKKQFEKATGKIAGAVLIMAGIGVMVWFAISHFKNKPLDEQTPTQGSFFVAMPDSIKAKYDAHIEKLKSFCNKLTNEGKYTEPQIGPLVNAYLCFMQNKSGDGLTMLSKLDDRSLTPALADQKQIVNLLLTAQSLKQVKSVDENTLLPSLQWLHSKVAKAGKSKTAVYPETPENYNRFAITERNFYTYVLAPAYLRQGDTVKASLAYLKSNNGYADNSDFAINRQLPDFWFNYLHSVELKQIISWKEHPQAGAYLSFLTENLKPVNIDKLYELLGTIELREHHYSEATTAFQQIKNKTLISANYNGQDYGDNDQSYQGDPFDVELNDYPKSFGGKHYTKLSFAQKMAELETKLKVEPENADVYYQLASALYNTSTYGNSWGLISYQWSSFDFGRTKLYYYDPDYIKTFLAKQYYLKARSFSKNNVEFQAKCTFMAAKCEQKKYEAPSFRDYKNYDENQKNYQKSLRNNPYFTEMQSYKNTGFYKKAINECSYFSDFIDGK